MVSFWSIIVVFSACAAFQLAESRIQNDYRPNSLSASDETLSLSERREALYLFTNNLMNEYAKNFVGKTRDVLNTLILELEALTEKRDAVKARLAELKAILTLLDIESDDLQKATEIVTKLKHELDEPVNEPPEVVAALTKVGWMDMRHKLNHEMWEIIDECEKAFNHFFATLTPWERLTATTVDQRNLTDVFWTYFE